MLKRCWGVKFLLIGIVFFNQSLFIDIKAQSLDSLLWEAIGNSEIDEAKTLLNKGADVNSIDKNKVTALMWAVYKSDIEMVKFLVDCGADHRKKGIIYLEPKNLFSGYYGNLTTIAAGEGKLEILKYLIEELKIPFDDKELSIWTKKDDGWTANYWAVNNGRTKIVKYLLGKGADINEHNEDDPPLLIKALSKNKIETALFLIDKRADVNLPDSDGKTAVFYTKDISTTKKLIKSGANINVKDNYGRTPLFYVKDFKTIKYLIKKGVDCKTIDNNGQTAMFKCNNAKVVKMLIKKGANTNQVDSFGKTPIFYIDNIKTLEVLIDNNADVNFKDNKGYTPIWRFSNNRFVKETVRKEEFKRIKFLIEHGAYVDSLANGSKLLLKTLDRKRYDILEMLIKCNANLGEINRIGELILIYAIKDGEENIVELLINRGLDINEKDDLLGETAIFQAIRNENINMVKMLINLGASIELINKRHETPLIIALKRKNIDLMRILIDSGANVNFVLDSEKSPSRKRIWGYNDEDGYTPLFLAVQEDFIEGVKLLIEKGANINQKDLFGDRPICSAKSSQVAELLLDNGADIDAKNNFGFVPLFKIKNIDVLKIIVEKGANVDVLSRSGLSVLSRCCDTLIAGYFIDEGVDFLKEDRSGNTPFTYAVEDKCLEMASWYLKQGYDINNKNSKGQTALIILANKATRKKSFQFLLDNNADINIKDVFGKTALDYAKEKGNDYYIKILSEN